MIYPSSFNNSCNALNQVEINVAKCDMCKNIVSVKETKQSQDADDTTLD